DSNGVIVDQAGLDLETIKHIKEIKRERISTYCEHHPQATYLENGNIWAIPCQLAFPCATQNELDESSAITLVKNGCIAVTEGANMPVTPEGIKVLIEAGIAYGPGKAANAGGVATSAL